MSGQLFPFCILSRRFSVRSIMISSSSWLLLSHSLAEPVALIRLTQLSNEVGDKSYSLIISDLGLPELNNWTICFLDSLVKALLSLLLVISSLLLFFIVA